MRLLSEIRNYMDSYQVKSGIYHYCRKEFAQAVSFLRKALADEATLSDSDRNNARAHLTLALKGLGEKLAAEGNVAAGVEELQRAVQVDPGYPDVHFLLAGLLERMERPDEAVEAYRRAIECHPGYLEAHVALAECLIGMQKVEAAGDVLRRAVELKLDQVRVPFGQGLEALAVGEVGVARERFHAAFRAAPQLSKEHVHQALEGIRAEEYERAIEHLDRAIELHPEFPDLHNFRGIALYELERFDEAVAGFARAADLSPAHAAPRLNLAFALIGAGRVQESERQLEAILAQDPQEPLARAKLEELRAARPGDRKGLGTRS